MSDMRAVNLTTIEIPQHALFLNVNYRVKVLSRSLANFWIYDYHRVHVFDQITVYSLVQMCRFNFCHVFNTHPHSRDPESKRYVSYESIYFFTLSQGILYISHKCPVIYRI